MTSLEEVKSTPILPPRPRDSHKGMFGTIAIIGGSRGMAGAPALAGAAALRAGAGLVRILCPAEVQPTVASFEPSYMTYPLPTDGDGLIHFDTARSTLERMLATADVIGVGPGLGQSDDIRRLIRWLITKTTQPIVIDADALNALVGQTELLDSLERPVVLTPHPGEFARLSGIDTASVQASRIDHATKFAARSKHFVVALKGAGTIVTDGQRYFKNATGNPGMATGGSGDVLTGTIAALLGQKLPPFEATQLGVFLHGLAGDIARDQNGEVGLIAGDLVDALPDAFVHATSGHDHEHDC